MDTVIVVQIDLKLFHVVVKIIVLVVYVLMEQSMFKLRIRLMYQIQKKLYQ